MQFVIYPDLDKPGLTLSPLIKVLSGLVGSEKLICDVQKGCVLLSRDKLSVKEALQMIDLFQEKIDSMMLQLVDSSNEIVNTVDVPDPLDHVDRDVLDDLLGCGASPDGLRLLLAMEDEEIEE